MNRRTRSTFRRGRGTHPYLRVLAFRGVLAKERRAQRDREIVRRVVGRANALAAAIAR